MSRELGTPIKKIKQEYTTDRAIERDGVRYPLIMDGYFTVYEKPVKTDKGMTKAKFKAFIKYPQEYYQKYPTYLDGTQRPKDIVYDIVEIHNNGNIHGKIVVVTSFSVPKQFLTESEQDAFKNIGKYMLCRVATIVTIGLSDQENGLGIENPLPLDQRMYFGEAGGGTPYYDVRREDLYVYHEKMCELTKADISTLPSYFTDEQTELARVLFTSPVNTPLSLEQIKMSLKKILTLGNPHRDSIIYHIIKHIYPLGYKQIEKKLKLKVNERFLEEVNNRKYWESYLCEITATEKLLTYYIKEYGFEPTEKRYGYLIDMQVPIIRMLEKCQQSSHIPQGVIEEIQKVDLERSKMFIQRTAALLDAQFNEEMEKM